MTAATALFSLPIVTFGLFAAFAAADLRATMVAIETEDRPD
jgi:hypothetical protein